jgi:multidrug efflux system membrane fusion protein
MWHSYPHSAGKPISVPRMVALAALVGVLLGMGIFLPGCQQEREAPPAPPPPAVTVAHPIPYPVQSYYEYNGYLEAVETVAITARVKGFLNEVKFVEGREVKKDDLLFRIDPRPYEATVKKAEADRLKAVAEARKARSEAERAKVLLAKTAISPEESEQRLVAQEAAEATVKQAEALLESAKIEFSYTEIRAPIAGQISRTMVTKGNLVGQNENTMLTSIVSLDPLYVYFDAPERDLVEYQQSLRAQAVPSPTSQEHPVEIGVTAEQGYPHVGKIDFRENRVDPGTGTIRIRGRIPNPLVPPGNARLLYPGLYARVRVPAGPPQSMPVLPEDALMTGQEGRYVYVVGDGNVVQKRSVTVGVTVWKGPPAQAGAAGWQLVNPDPATPAVEPVTSVVAIVKGLGPNDKVVVNGLTRARPGAAIVPVERQFQAPPPPVDKK